jgi:hypothetical protein
MPRRVDLELADALADWLGRGVSYHGQRSEYATVTQVEPALVLELHEGRESLSEKVGNLVIPKDVRLLLEDEDNMPEEDDTAVVTEMADGRYIVRHFVDDQ